MKEIQQDIGELYQRWENQFENIRDHPVRWQHFEMNLRCDAQLIENRIRKQLEKHKEQRETYVTLESDRRKKLDEIPQMPGYSFLKQILADELKSHQELLQNNQKILEDLERLQRELQEHIKQV